MGFCRGPFFCSILVEREEQVGWGGGEADSRQPRRYPQPAGRVIYGEGGGG